ncbi:MAG: hypothetical protein ABWY96_05665 [Gaiellaceae bacterium]
MVKLLASTALLALALVLAAGCGGDDDDQSSSQAWADDFCSAAADWRSSLDDIISGFGSPSDLSEDAIRDAVDEGLDSTEQFLEDVEGLGTPDTEAGQEVNGIVDDMSASVQATVDDLRETLGDSSSLQDLLAAAPQAAAQLGDLEQELQTSLDELESVDTGELKSELDSNEDCAAAQSGSGS